MQKTQEKNEEPKPYTPYRESKYFDSKSFTKPKKEKSTEEKRKPTNNNTESPKKEVISPTKKVKEEPIKFTYYKETNKGNIEYISEFKPAKDVKEKGTHVYMQNYKEKEQITGEKEEK